MHCWKREDKTCSNAEGQAAGALLALQLARRAIGPTEQAGSQLLICLLLSAAQQTPVKVCAIPSGVH
jgi:hypothetical protein